MTNEHKEIAYHHYAFLFPVEELSLRLADVRLVLVAGCSDRAEAQASFLAENLFDGGREPERLTAPGSRFSLFKVGPALVSNHGMGGPSITIALHELVLMCRRAQVLERVTLIRFGTCGGIGVRPGTVCVTERAYDPMLCDYVELKICLRVVRRPCVMDQETAALLYRLARENPNKELLGEYEVRLGGTVAANDFYEEQGRTNGAICEHTPDDRTRFLRAAQQHGVVNIEMESTQMAAMCHKLGISFGIVCVALGDRLLADASELTAAEKAQFERRLFWLNLLLIRHKLEQWRSYPETN